MGQMSDLPTELKSGRMSPLARLPAFFALAGKRAVVAGGGQAAAWEAELLSASGAAVDVFAPHAGEDMRALATVPPDGAIILHQRAWNAADLSGEVGLHGGLFFRRELGLAQRASGADKQKGGELFHERAPIGD